MRDLSDLTAWIRRIIYRLDRLEAGAMLENASVTGGRVRFIGGTLRVDSGGRVEIVGTLDINGATTVTGTFTVAGPWTLSGAGEITGDVTSVGRFTQNGDWELNGKGWISGDIDLTGTIRALGGGKVVVSGGGGGDVVLDSTFGAPRVRLGGAQIDGGNSFTFTYGSSTVYFVDNTIRIAGIPTKTASETGLPAGVAHIDGLGRLYRIISG